MTKYNVKKIENTNTMTTTIITVCKKQSTAENRFTRFLESYDRCFTETMLKCFMNIKPVGFVNGEFVSQAVIEENDYTICVQISDNTYIVRIEFHHDENTTETNTTDTTDTANTNETTKTESDTTTGNTKENETTDSNETNKLTKDDINNVLESIGNRQLIKNYVDGINNGLQNDSYKQTRECFCKLVQILPNNYEICFTTKFNVDMRKVDEPIYNHRYKIIRDKTGLMFTIHKYSEVYHKYIPLKPETEITDIIRYIYFKTFDSVCRVTNTINTYSVNKITLAMKKM